VLLAGIGQLNWLNWRLSLPFMERWRWRVAENSFEVVLKRREMKLRTPAMAKSLGVSKAQSGTIYQDWGESRLVKCLD
jgi:hypothetical protein